MTINVTKLNKMVSNVGSMSPVKVDINGQTRLIDVSALVEKYNDDKTQMLKVGVTAEKCLTLVCEALLELSNPQLTGLAIASVIGLDVKPYGLIDGIKVTKVEDIKPIYENTAEGKRGRAKSDKSVDEL